MLHRKAALQQRGVYVREPLGQLAVPCIAGHSKIVEERVYPRVPRKRPQGFFEQSAAYVRAPLGEIQTAYHGIGDFVRKLAVFCEPESRAPVLHKARRSAAAIRAERCKPAEQPPATAVNVAKVRALPLVIARSVIVRKGYARHAGVYFTRVVGRLYFKIHSAQLLLRSVRHIIAKRLSKSQLQVQKSPQFFLRGKLRGFLFTFWAAEAEPAPVRAAARVSPAAGDSPRPLLWSAGFLYRQAAL